MLLKSVKGLDVVFRLKIIDVLVANIIQLLPLLFRLQVR
jgi:hypothetical protein